MKVKYIGLGKYNKKAKRYFYRNKLFNVIQEKKGKKFFVKLCVGSFWIRLKGFFNEKDALDYAKADIDNFYRKRGYIK